MQIFLSASVPKVGRGNFYENSDPFLIQVAIRELVTSVIRRHTLVWGGHPSITPMIWAICKDLGIQYAERVRLYQSRLFQDDFPDENEKFENVIYVDQVGNNLSASLAGMRYQMIGRNHFDAGIFVGGMEGILEEHSLFAEHQPTAKRIILTAAGGAAQQLGDSLLESDDVISSTVDFAELFDRIFPQSPPNPHAA